MPRYFLTLFVKGGANWGWSEVYPCNLANPTAAISALGFILAARLPLLGTDAAVEADRISDTDVKGDSIPSGQAYPQAGTGGAVVFPQVDVALSLKATDLTFSHRGTRWLHGVPSNQFTAGAYTPTSGFHTNLTSYKNAITGNGGSIASKIKGAISPPFYTFYTISSFFAEVNGAKKVGRPFGLFRGRRLIV